jgi:hypothetical protein
VAVTSQVSPRTQIKGPIAHIQNPIARRSPVYFARDLHGTIMNAQQVRPSGTKNLNGGLHGFYEKQENERQEVEESTVEESPEFDNPRYPHGLDPGISAPLHRNRIVPVERAA